MVTKAESANNSSSSSEKIPLINHSENEMKITPKEISSETSQTSYENEAVVVIEKPVQVGTELDGNRVINRSDMVLAPKGRERKSRKA